MRPAPDCRVMTAASRGLGGSAGSGAGLASCPTGRLYGNVPIRAIMGTLGLCPLGLKCVVSRADRGEEGLII